LNPRTLVASLFQPPPHRQDDINLRAAFGLFLLWLGALALIARLAWARYESGATTGLLLWALCGYMFYLSLCCTFLPAPTTWIVMLLASDYLAHTMGFDQRPLARLIVVASLGAMGTSAANLNEYHILTFILRYRRVAWLRGTRPYQLAARWFGLAPFWVVALFSLLPIPIDVVRWLAVACRYPRLRYVCANFLGRWFRYALLTASTIGLGLKAWHILVIEAALVAVAVVRLLRAIARLRQPEVAAEAIEAVGQPP
jgi:membrane protein YqaA with SNARE-associated domain